MFVGLTRAPNRASLCAPATFAELMPAPLAPLTCIQCALVPPPAGGHHRVQAAAHAQPVSAGRVDGGHVRVAAGGGERAAGGRVGRALVAGRSGQRAHAAVRQAQGGKCPSECWPDCIWMIQSS